RATTAPAPRAENSPCGHGPTGTVPAPHWWSGCPRPLPVSAPLSRSWIRHVRRRPAKSPITGSGAPPGQRDQTVLGGGALIDRHGLVENTRERVGLTEALLLRPPVHVLDQVRVQRFRSTQGTGQVPGMHGQIEGHLPQVHL